MRVVSVAVVAASLVLPAVGLAAGYREKIRVMPPALGSPSASLGGVTMTFEFQDTRGEGAVGQSGSRIWVVDNLEPTWGPAVRRAIQDAGAVVVQDKPAPWALVVELAKIEMQVDMLGGFVDVSVVETLTHNGEQVWRKNLQDRQKISGVSDLGKSISKVLTGVLEDAVERAGKQLLKAPASRMAAAPAGETTATTSGAQQRLAVMDFRGALPFATLKLLSDEARGGVLEGAGKTYLVMTRESVLALLKDKKCAAPDGCDVEHGLAAGADVVVTGDVVKLGKKFRTSIKVLDTHNGALLASKSVTADSEDALLDAVKPAVAAVIKDAAPR